MRADATGPSGDAPGEGAALGGKGAGLAALARAGMDVPPWFAVPAEACDRALERAREGIAAALAALPEGACRAAHEEAAARAAAAIRAAGLDPADAARLAADLDRVLPGEALVAVRSSAVGEDGGEDSFAGQLDSFLGVPRAEVAARVLDVVASAYGARALRYRRARGLPAGGARAAVLVQRLVRARRAGVLFTEDPAAPAGGEAVLVAGLGLGQGVVSGDAEVDTFRADLRTGAVLRREIARKGTRIALAAAGGTRVEPSGEPEAAAPALADAEVARVVLAGRRIAEAAGRPQDVEWALDEGGGLWILQARPITGRARRVGGREGAAPGAAPSGGREHVFDDANIVEGYPGLTSPLTFSVIRPAYEVVFREAARALGVRGPVLRRERALFAHLVALVEGRVVYDLLGWYRLYQLVPGFEGLLPAFEQALGLPRRAVAATPPARGLARLPRLAAQVRVALRLAGLLATHGRTATSFLAALDAERRRHAALDLAALDAHALLEEVEGLADRLNPRYAATALNDLFTFQLHALAARLLARLVPGEDPRALRDALLSGIRGVESLEPARSVAGLAALARAEARVRAVLESSAPPGEAWAALGAEPAAAAFLAAAAAHVARYGDRAPGELKLETPPLAERPDLLVALVRHALGAPERAVGAGAGAEAGEVGEAARAARARVDAALRGRPLRRAVLALVLARCRAGLRRREALRLARARMLGMARRCYRALGERLARAGLLAAPDDVFWLAADEISGLVRGHALDPDPRPVVAARRETWRRFAARRPAHRIVTRGIVLARPAPQAPEAVPGPGAAGEAGVLRGTGCCPGVARGPARLVLDPAAAPPVRGEVLVAPSTDPGWIFLMASAAALVSERGNPLSHTAIVGRELGVPTVVGVAGATALLRDGEPLLVDGAAGTVQRLRP
jgi:pyruvate,water dikinase